MFEVINADFRTCLPPCYIGNERDGVEDKMNSLLLRYCNVLRGVVIAYDNVKAIPFARIQNEMPQLEMKFSARVLVFRAQIGQVMTGVVNKVSNSHVGLLVHDLFNASISSDLLPSDCTYSTDNETWTLPSDGKTILVGTRVKFQIKSVEFERDVGMISICGSYVSDNEEEENKGGEKKRKREEEVSESPDTTPTSSPKRKKKKKKKKKKKAE